jgi:hypothetical protein
MARLQNHSPISIETSIHRWNPHLEKQKKSVSFAVHYFPMVELKNINDEAIKDCQTMWITSVTMIPSMLTSFWSSLKWDKHLSIRRTNSKFCNHSMAVPVLNLPVLQRFFPCFSYTTKCRQMNPNSHV